MIPRRSLLAGLAALPAAAQAQAAWPDRPVTMVVPYTPGGGADIITRALGPILERRLGQPVIVENRPGGGTAIASTYVALAKPDGYTLLMGATPLAINPALQPSLTPRDPMKELAPVGLVYRNPFVLHVNADLPVRSLAEFIAYARARPGKINYGSAGIGTVNHLAFALLAQQAGLDVEHVPYRGGAPALLDLRANRVQAMFNSALEAETLLKEGATRALGVSSATRLAMLPEVPPIAETVPGFDVAFWQGLFAPLGTPAPVLGRLEAALRAATGDATLRQRMAEQGVNLLPSGPADLAQLLAQETTIWTRLVRDANISVN